MSASPPAPFVRVGALVVLLALCSCAGTAHPRGASAKADAKVADKAQAAGAKGGAAPAQAAEVDPLKALDEAKAALARHPGDTQAEFDVGFAWQRRADAEKDETTRHTYLDSARVAFDGAIAADSTNVKALVHSGLVLEDLNQADDALKRYQRATEVAPTDPRPFVNLGSLLYFHFKRVYDAKVALTKALELDPNSADAHFNLGVLFADATMFREARTEWERVVAVDQGAARTLAQQNLDKIRPMLAAQDSAEAAAHAAAAAPGTSASGQAPPPPTPAPAPSASAQSHPPAPAPNAPPAQKGTPSAPK